MAEPRTADEGFQRWCDLVNRFIPTVLASPRADRFRASAQPLELGPVRGGYLSAPPVRSVRTAALIRRLDPEVWPLMLVTRGRAGIEQYGGQALLAAGDLVLFDTSHPYQLRTRGEDQASSIMIGLPRGAVPLPDRDLRPLAARKLPSESGVGGVLRGLLAHLAEDDAARSGWNANRLGSALVDVATVFLANLAGSTDRVPVPTRQAALLHEIKAFIDRNLADPRLTPAAVAAAHHISVRYLHRLFQPEQQTVHALIRARRLDRCVADLRQTDRNVAAVGARWGFADPATFNRTFRAAYGIPPGEYRRRCAG
jgi:AraC-like DNA-binding protein